MSQVWLVDAENLDQAIAALRVNTFFTGPIVCYNSDEKSEYLLITPDNAEEYSGFLLENKELVREAYRTIREKDAPKGKIKLDSSIMEAAIAMAEGNAGAATVVGQLLADELGFIDLCHLDDMRLYGPNIWLAYKDVCRNDLDLLREKIRDRSILVELEKLPYFEKTQ
jgi:hypothetical protein